MIPVVTSQEQKNVPEGTYFIYKGWFSWINTQRFTLSRLLAVSAATGPLVCHLKLPAVCTSLLDTFLAFLFVTRVRIYCKRAAFLSMYAYDKTRLC